jgi:hypothetical protein
MKVTLIIIFIFFSISWYIIVNQMFKTKKEVKAEEIIDNIKAKTIVIPPGVKIEEIRALTDLILSYSEIKDYNIEIIEKPYTKVEINSDNFVPEKNDKNIEPELITLEEMELAQNSSDYEEFNPDDFPDDVFDDDKTNEDNNPKSKRIFLT